MVDSLLDEDRPGRWEAYLVVAAVAVVGIVGLSGAELLLRRRRLMGKGARSRWSIVVRSMLEVGLGLLVVLRVKP